MSVSLRRSEPTLGQPAGMQIACCNVSVPTGRVRAPMVVFAPRACIVSAFRILPDGILRRNRLPSGRNAHSRVARQRCTEAANEKAPPCFAMKRGR